MNKTLHLAIFASILISLCSLSHAQTCQNHKFSNQNTYTKCIDLPLLKSFLHWNFTESSSRLDLAFRHVGTIPSEWIAWAINPQGLKMIGSQALVAYQRLDGPFRAYTSPIYSYNTELPEGKLSFTVSALSATFENGEKTIFASLQLPYNTVTINQVWQNGLLNGNAPAAHTISPDNLHSCGTLNLITGAAN